MKRSTAATDRDQLEAATRYAHWRGLQLEPAPGGKFAPYDYNLRDPPVRQRQGEVREVIEVKCRKQASTTYPTVWCEVHKLRTLAHWAEVYSCEGYFVVRWADGAMRRIGAGAGLEQPQAYVSRKDRDDPRDRDLVCLVPIYTMEVVP